MIGKTGQLIGAVGSGLWTGATGAVSLGLGAIYTGVSTGVSVGGSVVSGVASYLPSLPRRGAATSDTSETPESTPSAENEAQSQEAAPTKPQPSLISKVLFRTPAKDKAE